MATQISFRNPSPSNCVKVTMQDAVMVESKTKAKIGGVETESSVMKHNGQWRSSGQALIVKPNENGAIFVGPGRRVIIEEMPT